MEKYQLHYSHPDGRIVGDVMPYFYNKEYHVFYLLNGSGHNDINHEHAVSTDLIHWRNIPATLRHEDNCIFTGCYLTTPDGIHHCFFTRWNPENINGRESIGHAISHDLINWEKTNLHLVPDGVIYSSARYRDFRDPCVFYEEKDHLFHMLLLANKKEKENTFSSWDENWIQGHYISKDLSNWTPLPPLLGSFGDECPDYIFEKGTHYIHGCHHYASAPSFLGPYVTSKESVLDIGLRAAKMCTADNRRLWFGGFIGGSFTLPRELVIKKDKTMGLKLAKEIYEATNQLLDSSKGKIFKIELIQNAAHRLHIEGKYDESNQVIISFGETKPKTEISIINKEVKIQLGNETKSLGFLNGKTRFSMDIIIDADLIEVYWCNEGTYTFKVEKSVSITSITSKNCLLEVKHFRNIESVIR